MSNKGVFKKYRKCKTCNELLPLNRSNYRSNKYHDKEVFQFTCRNCQLDIENMPEIEGGNLLCHRCKKYLNPSGFTSNGSKNENRGYKKYVCKKCANERQKEYLINLDIIDTIKKCLHFRLLGARLRAKENNIKFEITLPDLLYLLERQNYKCALSKIDLTFELRKGRIPTNASIDQKIPSNGYTKNNIQLVYMAVNQMKSDLSLEELYMFCDNILKYKKDA